MPICRRMHWIDSNVLALCERFGMTLAERYAEDDWVYDGDTVAVYAWRNDPKGRKRFSDHEILHELAHFVAVQDPDQRLLPEFGLMAGILVVGAIEGLCDFEEVHYNEQDIQELLAQKLCIYWGRKYNISPIMSFDPEYTHSWNHYETLKNHENRKNPHRREVQKRFLDLLPRLTPALL